MQVTEFNDVKVYDLSAGQSTLQFEEEALKGKKSLRRNEEFRGRIDLIQDFEFQAASKRVRVSDDGKYIAACGVYGPEVRIFSTTALGMKCFRGLDAEVVDLVFLSEDYRKIAMLEESRCVEVHSQFGRHHRVRVPKEGRSLCYEVASCVLNIAGSSSEVYRLHLEQGTFVAPIALQKIEEVNQVITNPMLPILSCVGNSGIVESYDMRDCHHLSQLQVCKDGMEETGGVRSCAYSDTGMQLAVGMETGMVQIFDIRSCRPLLIWDHMNGSAVHTVSFHRAINHGDGRLLVGSADEMTVKVWDTNSGDLALAVQSKVRLNHVTFVPNSGLFFCAREDPRIGTYFSPALGLAPDWCGHLDGLTEELEETKSKTVFDNYQFVTMDQLEELNAAELIGTKFLRPYMHGFIMTNKLYGKLKLDSNPFAFEEFKKERRREKMDEKRSMRTRVQEVKVNQALHDRWTMMAEKKTEKTKIGVDLLKDARFSKLFDDPDFTIQNAGEEQAVLDMEKADKSIKRGKKRKA